MTLDYEMPRTGRGQTYWWVVTTNPRNPNQNVLIGCRSSESEAYKLGLDTLGGQVFEVIALDTRNRHEAVARLKGKKLMLTKDIVKATTRFRHYKPEVEKKEGGANIA